MRLIVFLLLIGVTVGCASYTNVTPRNKDTWVAVRISYISGGKAEFYSKIDSNTYNKLTTGQYTSEWVQLNNVFWHKNGVIAPQKESAKGWLYDNTMLVRQENIERIILVDEIGMEAVVFHFESSEYFKDRRE